MPSSLEGMAIVSSLAHQLLQSPITSAHLLTFSSHRIEDDNASSFHLYYDQKPTLRMNKECKTNSESLCAQWIK